MEAEPDVEQARRAIAETARAMLAGRTPFIEGARSLIHLRWIAKLPEFDEDMLVFVGIDSETDALPLGPVRQHWAPTALDQLQPEIDRAERWARDFGTAAGGRLVERFGERGGVGRPLQFVHRRRNSSDRLPT
jgi:hypothetical protein